jgi:methylene-tetrahydromethanopterin dehydrogenase
LSARNILHMITPLKHMSPFDVNMAVDAGFDVVVPYNEVNDAEVAGLVQDAIFSRPPDFGPRTGLFIAGKNAIQALEMMDKARQALVPPFGLSIFADPAGSFTTAAAMVARTEKLLEKSFGKRLSSIRLAVFGATGVVGFSAATIAALEGASVTLCGYDGVDRVAKGAAEMEARFGAKVKAADASTPEMVDAIIAESDVVFTAGKAAVQIISKTQIDAAKNLLVAADVNAVPPAGIEGLKVDSKDQSLNSHGTLGIGPLAIGNTKYKTQSGLFKRMIEEDKTVSLDFRDAFRLARVIVSS